jgi:D-serine deaminase-like pyridoxal phosphate-dependent protein
MQNAFHFKFFDKDQVVFANRIGYENKSTVVNLNEEHLVLKTPKAADYQPGDELLANSRHACPTSAMHRQAYVVRGGEVVDRWDVVARDRWLTV